MIYYNRKCFRCDVELTTENLNQSDLKSSNYTCKDCRYEDRRKKRVELKQKIITAYGAECVCCKEDRLEFMTIDHKLSNGAEHRKNNGNRAGHHLYAQLLKNNFPKDEYQLMCWNCNKGKINNKYCPHIAPINIEDFVVIKLFENNFNSKIKICIYCGIELNKDNSSKGYIKNKDYQCNFCVKSKLAFINLEKKIKIINEYGNVCTCCGEDNISFLNIDHIDETGADHKRQIKIENNNKNITLYNWLIKNNYPKDNFQLLCTNCNSAKYHYGKCPHQKENSKIII